MGFGSLYLDDGKKVTWVCNLNSNLTTEIIYLQPGNYKMEFRYESIKQTIKTIERKFTIKSNSTTNITIN
jgi:hypothetical protein